MKKSGLTLVLAITFALLLAHTAEGDRHLPIRSFSPNRRSAVITSPSSTPTTSGWRTSTGIIPAGSPRTRASSPIPSSPPTVAVDRLQRPVRRQYRCLRRAGRGRDPNPADLAPLQPTTCVHSRRTAARSSSVRGDTHSPTATAQLFTVSGGRRHFPSSSTSPMRVKASYSPDGSASPTRLSVSGSASGRTTAAARCPRSGSTPSRITAPRRSRSPRDAATTPIRCGSATRSTSVPTATASSTSSPSTPASKAIEQLTRYTDFPIVDASPRRRLDRLRAGGHDPHLRRRDRADQRSRDRYRHRSPGASPPVRQRRSITSAAPTSRRPVRGRCSRSAARSSPFPRKRVTRGI